MKIKLPSFILLSIMLTISTSALACKGTEVLFQDNFSKLDPAWGTPNDEQTVSNNKLVLVPRLNISHTDLNQSNLLKDIDYCVDIKLAKGDSSLAGGGVTFWAKDYNDYYYFYIYGDGSYNVGRFVNGRILNLVPLQKNLVVNTASGAVNHLRVVTKNNQATIYINDKELATFTGQPPEGGSLIGVAADSPPKIKNTWEFSNLKITKPT